MGPSLQGKVCLVTGAARGIGRGELLLFNGYRVSGFVVLYHWAHVEVSSCLMVSRYRVSGSGVFDYWVSAELSCHSLGYRVSKYQVLGYLIIWCPQS